MKSLPSFLSPPWHRRRAGSAAPAGVNARVWAPIAQAILIILGGIWALGPALRGDWLWDDDLYITENPVLRAPGALAKIWLHPSGVNYFPVTETVQWCQWQLWHDHTFGYHLTNLVLHLISAFLVWRLLNKLGVRPGWIGGLIFAVHPVAVESVAWVAEIKNVLSLPPLLLAACACVDSAKTEHNRGEALRLQALFWFLIAMLCKSTVAMFPVLILIYAWWRRGRIARRDLTDSLPFFLVSAVLSLVTVWFERHRAIDFGALAPGHGAAHLAAAGVAAVFYLDKCVCPVGLLSIYPRWNVDPPRLVQFLPWFALAALWVWFLQSPSRRGGRALLGAVWFGANIVPVLGLVPMSYQSLSWAADHFAYISLVSIAGAGAAGWAALARLSRLAKPISALAAAVVLGVLAGISHGLAGYYRNSITLWSHTLRFNPTASAARENLGSALAQAGRLPQAVIEFEAALRLRSDYGNAEYNLGLTLAKMGRSGEAMDHYERALRLQPQDPKAENNLGSLLSQLHRFPEAIAHLEHTLSIQPDSPSAHNNLGLAFAGENRWSEAIAQYRDALRLDPAFAEAHNNLGNALDLSGRTAEAVAQYLEIVRLEPGNAEAHFNLGNALSNLGRLAEAIGQYGEALRLRPKVAEFHINLADALETSGRHAEAIVQLSQAEQIEPDQEMVHFILANRLFHADRMEEAVVEYEAAVRLRPDHAEAHNNLGSALLLCGHPEEAIAHYREALRLAPNYPAARANLAHALRRTGIP